eukprot:1827449-Amphidinium_carterae.1
MFPKCHNNIVATMRVDLLDAVPRFLVLAFRFSLYELYFLLPSTDYSKIGIERDIVRAPPPMTTLKPAIQWLEAAQSVKPLLEPRE